MRSIVSFSGGKDSTAMLLMMIERGMQIDKIVFGDTLLEFPEMYIYIDRIEKYIGRKILKLTPKSTFFRWFYGECTRGKNKGKQRGFPPQRSHCYWSREVKEYTLKKHCYGQKVYLGIARDERHRCKDHPKFEANYLLDRWGITESDCISYLKDKKLENPLYEYFNRTGCWICPKQSLCNLKIVYTRYPLYWRTIKVLDQETTGCKFRSDYSIEELEQKFRKN